MAMFSKALSSLTSNISSAYSLSQQPTSLAGPWKIYDAKHRKTGKPASVFVFSPKVLDQQQHGALGGRSSGGVSLKKAQEEVVDRLKREAGALARLRHPSILELAEPVEETRNGGLMFATEPVTASLAQVLQDKDGSERGGGRGGSRFYVEEADGTRRRKELEVDELEIQKGLLQLGKGLEFLHESAGLVHANLTPESILINAKGDWKIAGLAFCGPHESSTSASSMPPISLHEVLSHDPRLPRNVQLDIDYTSPDFVLDNHLTSSADMFSLGLLIVALYNTPHTSPLKTSGSLSTYKRTFSSSSTIPTQHNNFHVPTTSNTNTNPFPPKLATDLLPRLITRRPAQRLTAREFQEAAYFDNILVSTIRFLDALPAKTPQEKAAFMRGLPRIMPQFPKSVLEKKVLPALLEEMKDRELLAPILTCVFAMVQAMPTGKRAFEGVVAPKLREVFLSSSSGQGGGKHVPSQQQQQTAGAAGEKDTSKEAGLMVLLENMGVVATHCDGRTFREDIFPILLLALDASTTHGLVDAALGTLPVVLPVLDFSTIKNELFPVIAGVFAKTSSLAIKIRGLEAFYTLCGGSSRSRSGGLGGAGDDDDEADDDLNGVGVPDKRKGGKGGSSSSIILDKFTVQEKVVPLLKGIKTKEPGVMMAALKVFRQVGEVADSEFLAVEVLPVLWQMSLGPLLNLQQFQGFMRLVKRLSERIEREQTRKLQEMGGGNGGVGVGGVGSRRVQQVGGGGASNGLSNGEDADFETLVSGRKPAAAGNDDLMNDWGVPSTTPAQSLGTQAHAAKRANGQPTFSWQTPSPASSSTPSAPQQPAMNALRSGAQAGRTITPDQTLSSFASLTPQSAFSQPLQPTRTGSQTSTSTGSMPLRPAQQPPQQSSGFNTNGPSLDWSAAAATKNSTWTVPRPQQQQQQQQRQTTGPATNGFGGATAKPPGAGFGLPPPPMSPQNVGQFGQPGGGQRQGSWGMGQQQQQQMGGSNNGGAGGGGGSGGGGGLDRYESLI